MHQRKGGVLILKILCVVNQQLLVFFGKIPNRETKLLRSSGVEVSTISR